MKPGPKGQSPDAIAAKASHLTGHNTGEVVSLFEEHLDPEELPPPRGASTDVKRLWRIKVERYRKRGQKVDGFQEALLQYCHLECALADIWKSGKIPSGATFTAWRLMAENFFDTPASQKIKVGRQNTQNKFIKRGRPPKQ